MRLSKGTTTAESNDLLGVFTLTDRRMYEDKAARRKIAEKGGVRGVRRAENS